MNPLKFEVDLNLLKKYDKPGPRYTSYPTAPQFHSGFGAVEFYREIVETNENGPDRDVSLYFHLPFCDTLCYFCACNMIITHSMDKIQNYVDYLKREIDLVAKLINPKRRVVQHHWGGGTPTYLSVGQMRDLFGHIKSSFNFADNAEISIEVDPRALSEEHLPTLREIGFNRVSFGVQDFHEDVQKAVNRIQPEEMTRGVVEVSRRLGFESINIDLIYGLPHQTLASYAENIDKVLSISPDRLAVFNYAHVPWMKKHQTIIPTDTLPKPEEKLQMLKLIIERLTEAGYVYIGMDHFAKPNDELTNALCTHTLYRNFQGYSTYANAEIYAMGMTSISQLYGVYAQNIKELKPYQDTVAAGKLPTSVGIKLSPDDQIRRHVITELMCNNRIIKSDINRRFEIDFDAYFADELPKLTPFVDDGLLELRSDRIQVHEPGRLVIRNMAMVFDAYLEKDRQSKKPIYSRTV